MTPLYEGNHYEAWHCLGVLGVFGEKRLMWIPRADGPCLSVYLGQRDRYEFTQNVLTGVGIFTDNAYVSGESNMDFALFPFGESSRF